MSTLTPLAKLYRPRWRRYAKQLREENARLARELDEARRCPITGLWTRRAWEKEARRIVAAGPAVLLFIDLDGFKPVNDRFGHATGDAVLRRVARRLELWCATDGVAGRFGGDEFVVVVPAAAWPATHVGELRTALRLPIQYGGHTVSVGASIGISRINGHGPEDAAEQLSAALGAADLAMYQEKAQHHGGVVRDRRGRPVTPLDTTPVGDDPGPVATE